jgi:phosphate transport system protein
MASLIEIELAKLKSAIIEINNLAEIQVFEAMKFLLSEPTSEGKELKKTENKIDKLDVKIEDICQSVFALQQPVASDLRFIMSAMQISNEIERIGDLALSIIKKSKNVKEKHDLMAKHNIADLAKDVEQIIVKTKYCFEYLDTKSIEEVFSMNKIIRIKSEKAIQDIIAEMKENSKAVVSGTHLVMILKHMERISEHSSNVVESVYFMINAKIIKNESK